MEISSGLISYFKKITFSNTTEKAIANIIAIKILAPSLQSLNTTSQERKEEKEGKKGGKREANSLLREEADSSSDMGNVLPVTIY